MNYAEDSKIKGLFTFQPTPFFDVRGEYINTYNTEDYGFLNLQFVEDDFSISTKHVLRGLHGDSKTKKLIQCLQGSILLAVADLRRDSKSYLETRLYAVNDKNRLQVLVPEGCINGHLVLSDSCIFSYKQTELYTGQENQISVRYDDPWLNIPWRVENPLLSTRDSQAKHLKDMEEECRKL
jgi:dTDP-4-dehydrorhamnose 3,5-epimerase